MPNIQSPKPKIRCISCSKIIAEGSISSGEIAIKCRCGVINTIKAEKKPEGPIASLHNSNIRPERTTIVSVLRR